MTTPNIEELIDRLYDWYTTSAEQNRLDMQKAADILQSQAERINELEAENGKLSDLWSAMKAKRDTLRAQLAEIAATEPVATLVVEWVFHEYDNSAKEDRAGYVSASFHRTAAAEKMPIGKYALFTRPMPAQDVTELVEAFEHHIEQTRPIERSTIALSKYKGAK